MPARAVDDDADARFVEDDLADESTVGIGTRSEVCASVAYVRVATFPEGVYC